MYSKKILALKVNKNLKYKNLTRGLLNKFFYFGILSLYKNFASVFFL